MVNDAKDLADPSNWHADDAVAAISSLCKREGLTELRYPQALHRRRLRPPRISLPASRTAESVQFGYDYLVKSGAKRIAIIDADMFPIAPFSFAAILGDADLVGVPQERTNRYIKKLLVKYLWNGILLINLETLRAPSDLNLDCGYVNLINTDVGGKISLHLKRFPGTRVRHIQALHSGGWSNVPEYIPPSLADFIRNDPTNTESGFFSEIYANCFFHFRGGGNWQAVQGGRSFADRYELFLAALRGLTGENSGALPG